MNKEETQENVFRYDQSTSGLSNTTLYYQILAYDLAGNFNQSETLNLSMLANNTANNSTNSSNSSALPRNTSLNNTFNITSPVNGLVLEVGNSTLFNVTTNLTGNLSYFWNFGDGTNSTSASGSKTYLSTGNYTLSTNVSNENDSQKTNVSVIVNDTVAPTLETLSYRSEVHLSRDVSQLINVTFFDYSGLSAVKLKVGYLSYLVSFKNNNTYFWNLSSLTVGNKSFTLEAIDNFTIKHSKNFTYNFTVISCLDAAQNGDETGIDCGGSCSNCTSNSTNSSNVTAATVSTPAVPSAPVVVPKQTQSTLSTASTGNAAQVQALEQKDTPLNWTNGLKENSVSKKETALYILGGLVIFLLGIYTLFLMKNLSIVKF